MFQMRKNRRGKGVCSYPAPYKRYKIIFFKKLIGVTICNIMETLYW